MRHRATPDFWRNYNALPEPVHRLADDSFRLLKSDPRHPSLQLKKAGSYWSARVGIHYRALARPIWSGSGSEGMMNMNV